MADRQMQTVDQATGMVAQLRDMHRRLDDGRQLTTSQARLLADRFARYLDALDDGREASMDRELGLKAWGGVSPGLGDKLARRDELIRQLWRSMTSWRDLDAYAASGAMHLDASRYATQRWPRERKMAAGPSAEPGLTWWTILSSGMKIPGKKRLQQLLINQGSQAVCLEIQEGI